MGKRVSDQSGRLDGLQVSQVSTSRGLERLYTGFKDVDGVKIWMMYRADGERVLESELR